MDHGSAVYPLDDDSTIARGDHVRVPDGREGEVIGFYRREFASVVVRFSPRDSAEFFVSDLQPL